MSVFYLVASVLVALVLAAVVRPIWRSYRALAMAIVVLVPLTTALLYHRLGSPDAIDVRNVQPPRTMDEAIAQLERRLQREPNAPEGWLLLGRSRASQGQFVPARDAFAKAHELLPNDLDTMVEYADAQLRASDDGRFPDSARVLLERVVNDNPQQQRAVFLLGLQRVQSDRPAEAVALWERLLTQLDPETAKALQPQIAAARAEAGMPTAAALPMAASASVAESSAAATSPTLRVRVELADAFRDQIPDSAVLFVFARSLDGSNIPVAVKRLSASGFPLQLTLSDSDGLMPAQKLSMQSAVRLVAKISRSGDAGGSAGDFEASAQQVAVVDNASTTLRIDQVRQ